MNPPRIIPESAGRLQRMEPPKHPRLGRMRFLSRLLDNAILLPGGYRIGIDPIIGLVPGVGDFIASTLSFWLIYDAARLGISKRILARMAGNVLLESLFGVIPVLGDIVDAAWKANARNMQLVENNYTSATRPRTFGNIALAFFLALFLFWGFMLGILYLVFKFIAFLFS